MGIYFFIKKSSAVKESYIKFSYNKGMIRWSFQKSRCNVNPCFCWFVCQRSGCPNMINPPASLSGYCILYPIIPEGILLRIMLMQPENVNKPPFFKFQNGSVFVGMVTYAPKQMIWIINVSGFWCNIKISQPQQCLIWPIVFAKILIQPKFCKWNCLYTARILCLLESRSFLKNFLSRKKWRKNSDKNAISAITMVDCKIPLCFVCRI